VQRAVSDKAEYTPYVGVGGMITRALSVEGTATPAKAQGFRGVTSFTVELQPSSALVVSSEYTASDVLSLNDVTSTTFTPIDDATRLATTLTTLRATRRSSMLRYSPTAWNDHAAIEASESSEGWNGVDHGLVQGGVSLQAGGVQLRPYWRTDMTRSDDKTTSWRAFGVQSMLVPSNWFGSSVGTTWVRSLVEVAPNGMSMYDVALGRAVRTWRVELGMRKVQSYGSTAWTISASPILSKLQFSSFASGVGNSSTTTQTVRGSAAIDISNHGVALSSEPSVARGGMTGIVYFDKDLNGRRDADEEGLPGVVVRIGNRAVTTDSTGAYTLWGVEALSEQHVSIDSASLTSPWWIPATQGLRVRVPAIGWARADLPVVSAGVVDGSVVIPTELVGVLPTALRVIAAPMHGEPVAIDVFTDGTFYRDGLRPGKYTLTVDETSLRGTNFQSGSTVVEVSAERHVTNVHVPLTRRK
jgi:hypothetical protein